jgi:hypothetical protein
MISIDNSSVEAGRSQTSIGNLGRHLKQNMILGVTFRRVDTVGIVRISHGNTFLGTLLWRSKGEEEVNCVEGCVRVEAKDGREESRKKGRRMQVAKSPMGAD